MKRDEQPVEPMVEPLSRREREILALLAQGNTGPDIAAQLSIALSSVRTHLLHLYGKLGVNGKSSALNRARALGLLESHPPAARPVGPTSRHNLAAALTRFFGRELEITQLQGLLAENRLVTITGPGGVGKTRLALRVAEAALDEFLDGVWFVDLAALSNPALVAQAVAVTLGVRGGDSPIRDSLIEFLHRRELLLILDNCEHLLEACARLADSLLRACPGLTILATSREPLASSGEAVFPAPSLAFPGRGQPVSLESLAVYPAVRLFVDRARLATPTYQINAENAAALAQVCQRLDGMPLAIEMAAARMNTLNAEQLASRLDDAFRALGGGQRTALPRQQTLRATIDWSYALLNAEERMLLQRLSVFARGCTLEAAEAVCAGEGLAAGGVLDVLASLVAKSMVLADHPPGDPPRYHLLETVRQYAQVKQAEAPDCEPLQRRHRDYFFVFVKTIGPKMATRDRHIWTRRFNADLENIRLALELCLNDPTDVEAAPLFIHGLPFYWTSHQENQYWRDRVVAWCERQSEVPRPLYARMLGAAAVFTMLNDPPTALAQIRRAIDISRRSGREGRDLLSGNSIILTNCLSPQDGDRAPVIAEAEAICAELKSEDETRHFAGLRARFAHMKANLANDQARYQEAKTFAGESIRQYAATGDRWAKLHPLISLGTASCNLGEYAEAREAFLEALSLIIDEGRWPTAYVLRWLGLVDLCWGKLDRAVGHCQASVRAATQEPDNNIIASCLGVSAAIAAKQDQATRAARLSGAAQALYTRQQRPSWEDSTLDTLLPGWRDGPERAAIEQAYADGQAMSVDEARTYVLGDTA